MRDKIAQGLERRFFCARDCCLTCDQEDGFRIEFSVTDGWSMIDASLSRETPAQSCQILFYIYLVPNFTVVPILIAHVTLAALLNSQNQKLTDLIL